MKEFWHKLVGFQKEAPLVAHPVRFESYEEAEQAILSKLRQVDESTQEMRRRDAERTAAS